jgi:acetyltransferase-like isoleucine patch superfamily enzyme
MSSQEHSQLRKHLKFSLSHKWRALIQKKRLGFLGKKVWIDKRVEFMRFPKKISIDAEVVVKEGARICACNREANISIGKRTTVGYHTFIFASSRIEIGNDCLIAPFVYIVDSNHSIVKNKRINQQRNSSEKIVIKDDVWLGSNVTILKGVTIGEGAVIAAGSLVNKDIEPYSINAGSPSKVIGYRE